MTTATLAQNYDEISTSIREVAEFEGGRHDRHDFVDLLVLNGSYKAMGRQYGTFMKEKLEIVKDDLIQQYIATKVMSYDTIKEVIGKPFYKAAPKRFKDLYAGVAEVTGLDVYELSAMDQQLNLVLLQRRVGLMAGCTSLVAWGRCTKDGGVYTGRNLDFPKFLRDLTAKVGVLAVMNPIGGDFGYAGFGTAGMLSGFDDSMNSEGLYAEFNNGSGTIGATMYSDRINMTTYTADLLFQYSTQEEIALNLNSNRANYPCIVGMATPERGQFYEVAADGGYRAPAPEETDLTCRANQFNDPSWGIPDLPSPAGWHSRKRRESFTKLVKDKAPNVDEKVIMQAMNAQLFDSAGEEAEVGFSVFEAPGPASDQAEVTCQQVVTKPAERKMWVRIPTFTGWMEFDLKKYFRQGQSDDRQRE